MPPCETTDEQERLIWFAGGWFGTSLDAASVKPRWKTHWDRLLIYGLKLNFHRYTGQLRRFSPPHRRTPWRPLFVYKWRHVRTTITCTPSATIRTARRTVVVERHRRRRFVLLVCNKVTNDDHKQGRLFSLWLLQMIELSTNQKTNKCNKGRKKLG